MKLALLQRSLPIAVAVVLFAPASYARAQDDGAAAADRPPEVERLVELGKDPDRIREVMADPEQVREMMRLMESEAVREYVRDPQHVRELLAEVDLARVREAVRSADPSVVRQAVLARAMERLKQQLGATDAEWRPLRPRLEKLVLARQEVRAGIRGGAAAPGVARGAGGFLGLNVDEPSEVREAAAALREAADDSTISPAETVRRLATYRKARRRAVDQLEKAENEVRALVNARHEGILVMLGLLS